MCGDHGPGGTCEVGCKICPIHGGGDPRVDLDELREWAWSDASARLWGEATCGRDRWEWTCDQVLGAIERGCVERRHICSECSGTGDSILSGEPRCCVACEGSGMIAEPL